MTKSKFYLLVIFLLLFSSGCATVEDTIFHVALKLERSMSGFDYKTVDLKSHRIAYLERKGPGQDMVLLHGFGGNKDYWTRFVRHIPDKYHIYAFDLPGHGDSSRESDFKYDILSMAKVFNNTIDKLEIDPFHLAGNSLGGYLSTIHAANNPEDIISLCLIDPGGVRPPKKSWLQKEMEQGKNPLVPRNREEFDKLMDMGFYGEPPFPWPVEAVAARNAINRAEFKAKMWGDLISDWIFAESLLHKLNMPVLLIWGKNDELLDVSCVQVYEKHIPQIKTHVIEKCGHVPMLELPRETAGIYNSFLDSTSNSSQLEH